MTWVTDRKRRPAIKTIPKRTDAAVIDAAAAGSILAQGAALFIDVTEPARKPPTLPASVLWRPQHRSIPGAVWFPGATPADLPLPQEDVLKTRVKALTGDDPSSPSVTQIAEAVGTRASGS